MEKVNYEFVLTDSILDELTVFGAALDKLEENISTIEDITSRLESKLNM